MINNNNNNICETLTVPRDAVRALKKRLSQNCNHKEIRLTLSLLDLCVRNCGPSFRALVVKKDFAKDKLTELLNPRYNLPTDIQNQILTFVMTWSQGFEGTVDVTQVKELYLDLLKKGIRFPSSNTAAGTDAPERSVSGPSPIWPIFRDADPPPPPTSWRRPGQIGKLNSELDVVRMNVAVMLAILTENTPGSEDRDDLELLQVRGRKLAQLDRYTTRTSDTIKYPWVNEFH
uniref:VHS domain-containing protein n=1 Tax=Ornithorhynchus anatinus TaxID=9258 RepID=F7CK11_ORNAN